MKDARALTNQENATAPPEKLKLESAVRIEEEPPDKVSVRRSVTIRTSLVMQREICAHYLREGNDSSRRAIK